MRIVGGLNKGRRIKISKKGIRPTKGIVREAIFNIIGEKVQNACVLDIFAGSGALGLEAISRGAKSCSFIEKKPKILLQNIENLSLTSKTKVITGDFRIGLRKSRGKTFDLIFLDPPYNKNYVEKTIKLISRHRVLKDKGIIVAEYYPEEKFTLPDDLSMLKTKRYGETAVAFIRTDQ
ncbi:16S rRNA (guanine(966)-N(2))-methyltransferase RsmD [candidate division WOR-3 bacterium]|jgi:16S rRNA (guanine966-N2)-methyltransferase|nr:16S rRNA (guanine(966)-N(2))-methyltransferase RsmD [candidate division WOR-3 bacterium]